MCGKRLAIHANSFRKFNRRIRRRCAVWSPFVRSSCEQPRDKDGEWERGRGGGGGGRTGRGQGRPETKDRIEEKERKMSGPGGMEGGVNGNGQERIETRKESGIKGWMCVEANGEEREREKEKSKRKWDGREGVWEGNQGIKEGRVGRESERKVVI